MRIFLGLDLRDALGPAAHGWGRAVATAIGPGDAAALSWVPAQRIHVTLHFFGDLEQEAVAGLSAVLGDAVPEAPFDLELGGGGTFPATERPRVLWLGLGAGADAVTRLHEWLAPRTAGIGEPDRHAAFSPHVTIARLRRDAGPGLGRELREAVTRTPVPAGCARVDAITIFESVASAQGPTYLPLARLPLIAPIGPAARP
ncbi:MAG: RNA 2',3'-cyclic phosphodiesterase [Vicinamibacteraceae bacterium]